jgi:hypothetical protein
MILFVVRSVVVGVNFVTEVVVLKVFGIRSVVRLNLIADVLNSFESFIVDSKGKGNFSNIFVVLDVVDAVVVVVVVDVVVDETVVGSDIAVAFLKQTSSERDFQERRESYVQDVLPLILLTDEIRTT